MGKYLTLEAEEQKETIEIPSKNGMEQVSVEALPASSTEDPDSEEERIQETDDEEVNTLRSAQVEDSQVTVAEPLRTFCW